MCVCVFKTSVVPSLSSATCAGIRAAGRLNVLKVPDGVKLSALTFPNRQEWEAVFTSFFQKKIGEWWTSVPRATKMTFLRRVMMFVVAFDAAKLRFALPQRGGWGGGALPSVRAEKVA